MKTWIVVILLLMPLTVTAELGVLDSMVMPGKLIKGHAKYEEECSSCHVMFNKKAQDKTCILCHEHNDIENDINNRQGYHGRLKDSSCRKCHTDHKGRDAKIIKFDRKSFDHNQTDYPLRDLHKKVKCNKCHQENKKYSQASADCYACHKKDDKHKGGLGKKCKDCHSEKGWKKTHFDHSKTKFDLTGAHTRVKCKSCHRNNRFKDTPKDCYSCHRKDDVHKGKLGRDCQDCHSDTDWKKTRFDHNKTDYPLRGAHRRVKCDSCHINNRYKDTPQDCYSCHRKDDDHKGQLGKNCSSCHNETNWKKTVFDHDLVRFPLLGKHAEVKCVKCHRTLKYKDAPEDCYSCHKKEDKHKLRFGTECHVCHNPASWKKWKFDHDRQTGFKLDGGHSNLDCHACHKEKVKGRMLLSAQCVNCHEKDDVHDGGFGNQCERCHVTSKFSYIRSQGRSLH